jgi:hypothetical protein
LTRIELTPLGLEQLTKLALEQQHIVADELGNPRKKHPLLNITLGALGFTVAFCAAFLVEATLLYLVQEAINVRIMPRGAGWVAVPAMAGIAGWAIAQDLGSRRRH